jgi:hypothetical protein|nr:hypothetical protein [Kofleriaceae bacterium]
MTRAWLLAVVAACKHDAPPPAASPPAGSAAVAAVSTVSCAAVPFAVSTPVPEASGAAWLAVAGKTVVVTMGDSDRDGAYGLIDPESGDTLETGKLPLGDAGDDLEGLAVRDGVLYGLTSAGWMRAWKRTGTGIGSGGFDLVDGPYPLGPVDLPDKSSHDRPPKTDGMVCGARGVNCGRNYEGLCLPAHPSGACAGYAVAKADGHLYCLADAGDADHPGRFAVRREPALELGRPGAIADCAFAADTDELYVGANGFALNAVSRVVGWRDLATAHVEPIGDLGLGFCEGLAVRGDDIYRFSDLGGAPSLTTKFRCTSLPR